MFVQLTSMDDLPLRRGSWIGFLRLGCVLVMEVGARAEALEP
jgi:hypothetical protein